MQGKAARRSRGRVTASPVLALENKGWAKAIPAIKIQRKEQFKGKSGEGVYIGLEQIRTGSCQVCGYLGKGISQNGRREGTGELLLVLNFSCLTGLAAACSECFHERISLYGQKWEKKSSVG